MNCHAAREQLLTADVSELDGSTESQLSLHLRSCAACRQAAERLMVALRALDTRLALPPDSAAAAAARQAVAEATRRRRARARRVRRAMPLAAAAVLAGLLLARRGSSPTVRPPLAVPTPPTIHDVTVTALPPGRSLAVWHTADPNIVVIWFF